MEGGGGLKRRGGGEWLIVSIGIAIAIGIGIETNGNAPISIPKIDPDPF